MKKTHISMLLVGAAYAMGAQMAHAAPDWSKVPKRDVTVFHPGTTPIEWVGKSLTTAALQASKRAKLASDAMKKKVV